MVAAVAKGGVLRTGTSGRGAFGDCTAGVSNGGLIGAVAFRDGDLAVVAFSFLTDLIAGRWRGTGIGADGDVASACAVTRLTARVTSTMGQNAVTFRSRLCPINHIYSRAEVDKS